MSTIYKIVHKDTGRCYVGRSDNIKERLQRHKNSLRRNKHHSPHLQHAWNKYGEEAFEFVIIKETDIEDDWLAEQTAIDSEQSTFNAYRSAKATRKGTKQPEVFREEQRQRMKGNTLSVGRVHSEEEKLKRANSIRGMKRTEEQRQRMSEAMTGVERKLRGAHSEETRSKIREATNATRPTMTGKHHREDSKLKSSESNKEAKARKQAEALAAGHLTTKQAAEMIGVSPHILRKLSDDGSIPCYKANVQRTFLKADVEAFAVNKQ